MLMQKTANTMKTLDGARYILAVKNERKLKIDGPMVEGTEIRCLRLNNSGYHIPCVAFVSRVTPTGRISVDLWADKSERVTVSLKAILWP